MDLGGGACGTRLCDEEVVVVLLVVEGDPLHHLQEGGVAVVVIEVAEGDWGY